MNKNLLPAYSVFRVLANSKKSLKDVLKSFVATFIKEQYKKNTFMISDLANKFNSYYGFNIPNTIIKNLLTEKGLCTISKGGWYKLNSVFYENTSTFDLADYKSNTDALIADFLLFAKNRGRTDEKTLETDFINYFSGKILTDKNNAEIISAYIIKTQNSDLQKKNLLDDLNYGSIIYRGITMDLSIINSWEDELIIYLNTDILFDINGLNGEEYKRSAEELLALIKEVNKNKENIKLKYFNITKKEIDRFFSAAGKILCNQNQLSQSSGMDYLLSKCSEYADIYEQQALFYSNLKENNIFYDEDNKIEVIHGKQIDEFEEEIENFIDKNFPFFNFTNDYLSKIEELRDGKNAKLLNEAKYIFLTRTDNILKTSKEKRLISTGIGLAPTLEFVLTNLWFQLNKGFGVSELHTLDIVLRSKKIYAGIVADEQKTKINAAIDAYKENKFSENQVYEVIATLKNVSSRPEDITEETIDNFTDLNAKTLNQILETNALEKQNAEKRYTDLSNENQVNKNKIIELEKQISESRADAKIGKMIKDIGKFVKDIGKFIFFHLVLPVFLVLVFALVLKKITKADYFDFSFIFSNWISLLGAFILSEICTWINKIVSSVKKHKNLRT
ncbi:MAG: hypothetical protein HDR36_07115 [Treponema sp.]|nr:hypothetical protein [Treponema sp.]